MIDFKNTIILLTSNVGTDLIMNMCKDPELMPDPEGMVKALRGPLLKAFPAAFLGRLIVVPFYPLGDEVLRKIVRLQLGRIEKRIQENHRYHLPMTMRLSNWSIAVVPRWRAVHEWWMPFCPIPCYLKSAVKFFRA